MAYLTIHTMKTKSVLLTCTVLISSLTTLSLGGCDTKQQERTEADSVQTDSTQIDSAQIDNTQATSTETHDSDTTIDADVTAELETIDSISTDQSNLSDSNVEGTETEHTLRNTPANQGSIIADMPPSQPSIVVSDSLQFQQGSPEATLAKALNTIYYSTASEAAQYYQTDIENFAAQLAETQPVFQRTIQQVTLTDIVYNQDQTEATIEGTITLVGVEAPDPAEFYLKLVDGQWKLLG